MFSGMTVDNMIIGGPAYNSKLLERGDVICQIDRTPVIMDDLQQSLHGSDVPNSTVVLSVRKKTGRIIDVPLKRMAISVISDRCKMFELFAACKVPFVCSLYFREFCRCVSCSLVIPAAPNIVSV